MKDFDRLIQGGKQRVVVVEIHAAHRPAYLPNDVGVNSYLWTGQPRTDATRAAAPENFGVIAAPTFQLAVNVVMPRLYSDGRVSSVATPMLAREVRSLPQGEDWIYEFLWGGERVRAIKHEEGVQLISRDGRDVTNRFPRIAASVAHLRASYVVLDGEILYLDAYPSPVIRFLNEASDDGLTGTLAFLAFDLLCDDGRDVRNFSLLCRRLLLASTVQGTSIVLSPLIDARSEAARAASARLGFRGVVAKRAGSAYRPNSLTADWVKLTFVLTESWPISSHRRASAPPDGRRHVRA